jgi:hypothetical protein
MKTIKKIIVSVFALFIAHVSIAQTTYQANVKVTRQEQNQWCWDANSKCILEYYGTTVTQCTIAEYARTINPSTFGTANCCTNPSGKCNNPNYIEGNGGIQGMLKHFGNLDSEPSDSYIPVTKIQSELNGKRPFVIGVYWSGGGGHVVVGCNYSSGTLTFMDPWQNNGMTTYKYSGGSAFKTTSGSGTWGGTLVLTTPYVTTGIADKFFSDPINVYPNPSAGMLNIQSEHNLRTINVYNVTGQLIDAYSTIGSKSYSLKIPASGLYSLQIVTDNGSSYKKVVIQ